MRVGAIMWPVESWPAAGETWRRAEELGLHDAWVYDHVAWRGNTPWHDAYATLAAAAAVTSRIRIGTMVTSANFRHPVPVATAAKTIDDISGGRLTLGIGAGSPNRASDAGILGGPDWSRRERTERFAEWVELLDLVLRGPETTFDGGYYSAREVVTRPGCVQRPRVPFAIAARGPRGMRLAARHGDLWVTTGNPGASGDPHRIVRAEIAELREACAAEGRDPSGLRLLMVTGFTGEPWLESPEAFRDLAGRYADHGITDFALHWPRTEGRFAADMKVFEAIAAEHATEG